MSENSKRAERISDALKPQGGREGHSSSDRRGQISKADYDELMVDRPTKFSATEVGYRKAPRGSEQRCENCSHFYQRVLDQFHTCEIFRSSEVDEKGVDPKYLCDWWTSDGDNHPLAP